MLVNHVAVLMLQSIQFRNLRLIAYNETVKKKKYGIHLLIHSEKYGHQNGKSLTIIDFV